MFTIWEIESTQVNLVLTDFAMTRSLFAGIRFIHEPQVVLKNRLIDRL